jgi:demethylmenaquinone methyltransferase/2-methoxy-6-polyprenyl-1,4-benzoquinol methylase
MTGITRQPTSRPPADHAAYDVEKLGNSAAPVPQTGTPLTADTTPAPMHNPDASLQGAAKRRYVRGMFARIARRYDLVNTLMSLGQDALWRRYAARRAAPKPGELALDVGTGTGLLAQRLARAGACTIAVDFCEDMMLEGRRRGVGKSEPVYFVGADALKLPFPDDTFHCITTGFTMRNVVDIEAAFREMRRVLRPGGRLVCLEVGRPRTSMARRLHALYTRKVVPLLGTLLTGDADAYTYLPSSMDKFPSPPELARIMRAAGLRNVHYKLLTFGAVAVHSSVK